MAQNISLYSDGFIVTYPEGDVSLERSKKTYTPVSTDTPHTVVQGETLMGLANYYLGDELKWWMIADANDFDDDIFELVPGTILIIPNPDYF